MSSVSRLPAKSATVGARVTPGQSRHRAGPTRRDPQGHRAVSSSSSDRPGDRRPSGESCALGNLGLAWEDLGEPRKAIKDYRADLTVTRVIGDRRGEVAALGSLGNAWTDLGEPRKAMERLRAALNVARAIGDRGARERRWAVSATPGPLSAILAKLSGYTSSSSVSPARSATVGARARRSGTWRTRTRTRAARRRQ